MRKKGKAYYTKFITMSEKYKKTSSFYITNKQKLSAIHALVKELWVKWPDNKHTK